MFDMLTGQYKNLASKGRYGDTMLAHINPQEAALLKSMGGAGTVNPQTGLREFYGTSQMAALGLTPAPAALPAFGTPEFMNLRSSGTPIAPAPFDRAFADIVQGGYGTQHVTGYTVPTENKTFADIPLVTKYDPKGNFNYLTLEPGKYLTPDPNQPNIVSVPRLDASGNVVDWGISDLNNQDSGGLGSMISELATEFAPMILAGLGANLAAGNLGFGGATAGAAGGGGAAALSPYAAQAAGAYGGSSAAAAAAAAGNLTGIQAASAAQNALTAEALARTGITYGGNVTPADIPTTQAPTTPEAPSTPTPEPTPTPTPTPPVVPPTSGGSVEKAALLGASGYGALATPAELAAAAGGLGSLGGVGTAILDFAKANPSIAGSLLGAVTAAVGSANAPTSQTSTTSIDPQIKAEYLANLERAKATAAGLEARQIAQPGQLYSDAESKLYNLGMTPFGEADIAKFYNPYQEQVVQGALGDIERTRLMQEQANRDQATRARAFGGSRQGVVTGMTNEAALRQAATTGAQLRSAGFTQAANLGLQARPMDMAGLQTSLGLGTTRTALEQARLDALRNLGTERLGITSGALGLQPANVGQTSSQPLYNNTAGSLLSGGLTGAYIGSLLGK